MAKSSPKSNASRLPFRTRRGGVEVKPGKWQRLALVDLGKKFPKVRVDILSSGTKNTNFSVWLNDGRQPLSERYRFPDMGRRMVGTQDFNIGGTKLAVFAIGMEEGPSEFVEVAVYGVF